MTSSSTQTSTLSRPSITSIRSAAKRYRQTMERFADLLLAGGLSHPEFDDAVSGHYAAENNLVDVIKSLDVASIRIGRWVYGVNELLPGDEDPDTKYPERKTILAIDLATTLDMPEGP